MEPRALDGGARSFFVSSLYVVRVLQSARLGYTGANGNEAHQIQNNQVDNSSLYLYRTKPKTTRLQKRVSCGVVLMASTMLHEKCCNTVLQIGAPVQKCCPFFGDPKVTFSDSVRSVFFVSCLFLAKKDNILWRRRVKRTV